MKDRPRLYGAILQAHQAKYRQMAFVSGPRQVGKTTVCRAVADVYLNWDNVDDRRLLLRGPGELARRAGLDRLTGRQPAIVLDELHKHAKWKSFLKGYFDMYGRECRLIVTGSSRLEVYRRGGDSLMGRYLLYRMHPFSVAECAGTDVPSVVVRPPQAIADADWQALLEHGGFPEPFVLRDAAFSRRWRSLRLDQLSREDLRELSAVQHLGVLEALVHILAERSGAQVVYANLARELQVTVDTIRRWLDLLHRLHVGFLLRPWFTHISNSLRKEPKWYLRDWSGVQDEGARAETFVACHLLKAVEGWTDLGLGDFSLWYLRDKQKREVDFLVARDRKPWFLVEVKARETSLSPALGRFLAQTKALHAFQVVMHLPFEDVDAFRVHRPVVVPARTLLSQLL